VLDYYRERDRILLGLWALLAAALVIPVWFALAPGLPAGRQGGYRAMTTGSAHLDVAIMLGFGAYFLARAGAWLRVGLFRRNYWRR
jgi:hypothetical protein